MARHRDIWDDGVYFNIRLEDEGNRKQWILVLMGATGGGQEDLIALGRATGSRSSRGRN